MQTISLSAKNRSDVGHGVKKLRAAGGMPCVTYGHDVTPVALEVSLKEFQKVFAKAGSSTVVELDLEGQKKNIVINDVQFDPVTDLPVHADLYQVRMDEKITTEVPLKFVGVSRAVKDFGGILVKAADALEIEALPKDLPHEIEVDLSMLKELNDAIDLSDLKIPEGVTVLVDDKEFAIASVTPPRTEEELKALDEAVTEDVDAIEGVKPAEEGEEVDTEGDKTEDKPEAAPDEQASDEKKEPEKK